MTSTFKRKWLDRHWVDIARNSLPVTGPILQEKAFCFSLLFGENDSEHTASEKWLGHFKKQFFSIFIRLP